jgi:hypothetical protein
MRRRQASQRGNQNWSSRRPLTPALSQQERQFDGGRMPAEKYGECRGTPRGADLWLAKTNRKSGHFQALARQLTSSASLGCVVPAKGDRHILLRRPSRRWCPRKMSQSPDVERALSSIAFDSERTLAFWRVTIFWLRACSNCSAVLFGAPAPSPQPSPRGEGVCGDGPSPLPKK